MIPPRPTILFLPCRNQHVKRYMEIPVKDRLYAMIQTGLSTVVKSSVTFVHYSHRMDKIQDRAHDVIVFWITRCGKVFILRAHETATCVGRLTRTQSDTVDLYASFTIGSEHINLYVRHNQVVIIGHSADNTTWLLLNDTSDHVDDERDYFMGIIQLRRQLTIM